MKKNNVITKAAFLTKMNIPFWITFFVLLAFEIASSVFRGLEYDFKTLLYIVGAFDPCIL